MTKQKPSAIRVTDMNRMQHVRDFEMVRVTAHSGRIAAALIARASPWSGRRVRQNVMADLLRFLRHEEGRALSGGAR
jgi:hypothetical protein